MLTSKPVFLVLGILSLNTPLSAQITTDGTLGVQTNLTGPNFQIPANLGQQFGGNLFHSFKEFNINTGQSATFTGPDTVQNILTRVTGGQRSWIDGPLRSEIPKANFYLLNPSGILFGKNAQLDMSGAFYASTADGVTLGEGGKFLARSPNNSVLTMSPPSAFGFLDSQPASIEIQGDTLAIRNRTYYAPNGQINVTTDGNIHLEDSTLYAPNGQIKIITHGELKIVQTSQNLFKQFGINPDGKPNWIANLDISGLKGGGNITLRANSFGSEKGRIYADLWEEKGKPQEIKPQEIKIRANETIHLTKGARITSDNFSISQGGSIKIEAHELQLEGANDEVEVVDDQSFFNSLTTIATTNYSSGQGGNIQIHSSLLNLTPGLIQSATDGEGDAGEINIEAYQVTLRDEAYIAANTKGTGKAGAITLKTDRLSLGFSGIYTEAVYEGGKSGGAAGGDITCSNA